MLPTGWVWQSQGMIRAILTDIEGTTSSLSFVKDILFPYARERLGDFVQAHGQEPQVREFLQQVSEVAGRELSVDQTIAQLHQWMDEDRKITPLKALQGLIWEAGYRNGDYQGHIYDDAVRSLQQWHDQRLRLYVYSSGSVYAQKLLFGHTAHGDLTALFSGYFDTQVGAKQESDSYRSIAGKIGLPPKEILFLSDIEAELDAAADAGMATCWLVREGALHDHARDHAPHHVRDQAKHPQVRNFEQIELPGAP